MAAGEDGPLGLAFAVGSNDHGELGLGHRHTRVGFHLQPVRQFATGRHGAGGGGGAAPLRPARHLAAAACGYRYTVGASASGRGLYSCGLNDASQLGHDDGGGVESGGRAPPWLCPLPVRLPPGEAVTMLACGYDHSLALTSRGRVLAWGERNSGQLGVDNPCCSRPQVVESLADKRIVHVSAGGSHSLVVTDHGNVWAFGSNLKVGLALGLLPPVGSTCHTPPQSALLPNWQRVAAQRDEPACGTRIALFVAGLIEALAARRRGSSATDGWR